MMYFRDDVERVSIAEAFKSINKELCITNIDGARMRGLKYNTHMKQIEKGIIQLDDFLRYLGAFGYTVHIEMGDCDNPKTLELKPYKEVYDLRIAIDKINNYTTKKYNYKNAIYSTFGGKTAQLVL